VNVDMKLQEMQTYQMSTKLLFVCTEWTRNMEIHQRSDYT